MPTSLFSNIPTEVEQGYIRFFILIPATIYLLMLSEELGHSEVTKSLIWAFMIIVYLIAVVAQILLIKIPASRRPLRWFLQISDLLVTTIFLFLLGKDGHLMFFVYLFVSIGYGIRYSLSHLKIGLLLSLCLYTIYLLTNDSVPERAFILSNYALLIILPPYIGSLIKKRDEALVAAKASSRAKTMFLANISHELRTPLVGVVTAAELMETSNWDEDNLSLLKTIQNSSCVLTTQINRILDYARIESGNSALELKPLHLQKLLDDCISILTPQARKKNIELLLHTNKRLSCIKSDDISLRQIIINIVGNAIKFTDTGSVTLDIELTPNHLSIVVTDTGIGIPADKVQTIFEPFTQADGTITKQYGGTGLGTAIAKQLVDSLGGEITLSSTHGIGTRVMIKLPCTVIPDESCTEISVDKTEVIPVNNHARILVADDNMTNQHIIGMILKKTGFTNVDIVDNGEAAFSSMLQQEYDLVILDRHMPGMGGGEALRKYKGTGKDVQSILLTADQTQDAVDEFNSSGFSRLIIKPFTKDKLNHAISSLLSAST